jgi:hypothetical protein
VLALANDEYRGGRRAGWPTERRYSTAVDWDSFDPTPLFEAIRERGPAPDAEQTVWALERALQVARTDGAFVEHLVVASVCLLAFDRGETPRTILEQMFRRSVSDREWQESYARFAV